MHTSKYINLSNFSQIFALELDPRFTTLNQLPDAQDREDMGAIWGRGRNFGGNCLDLHRGKKTARALYGNCESRGEHSPK